MFLWKEGKIFGLPVMVRNCTDKDSIHPYLQPCKDAVLEANGKTVECMALRYVDFCYHRDISE